VSREGSVRIIRPTTAERCAELVADAAREMIPACGQAVSFFFRGMADFITTPIDQSVTEYRQHIRRRGATQINVNIPQLSRDYEALRDAVLTTAARAGVRLPEILTEKPPVVTAESIRIQSEVLDTLRAGPVEGGERALLDKLAQQLAEDRDRTQEAFEQACLVAGRHMGVTGPPAFNSLRDFVTAGDGSSRGAIAKQLAEWSEETGRDLQRETRESWTAAALAASKLAIEAMGDTSLRPTRPDISGGTVVGQHVDGTAKRIEVKVNPDSGEIRYEVFGYEKKKGACERIEQRFLEELSSVLGVRLGPDNVRSRSTLPPERPGRAPAPRRKVPRGAATTTEQSPLSAGTVKEQRERDRRRQ
jgi:hypothetical protein